MVPTGVPWGINQHHAADQERRSSDGIGESLDVAVDATSEGFNGRGLQSTQVAFGKAPESTACIAGRIDNQPLKFACKRTGLFLYPFQRKVLCRQASYLFSKRSHEIKL